ncbi:MAG: substrate-binding domain-containing protein [Bacillus sp. (in: Bacteria)]|nr:substrate-binding domain-containing protein [Bacillus sp. (in: firmicutes)]
MVKPTIRDVARLAGVSMSTVSRVMNAPDAVRPDKREKVEKVIKELGYHPNALARGLIFKRTQTIGVLIPDVSNMYVAEVIRGMEDATHGLGSNLIICNTDRDKKRMVKYLKVLKEKQVDGIIFTSDAVTEEYFELFDRLHLPVVLASSEALDYEIPSVKVDDYQAAYDGTCYLLEKGHRRIGMISGSLDDPIAGMPRLNGFKDALRDRVGAEVDEAAELEYGSYRFEDGYDAMKALYGKNKELTALFVASDEMALGAISYLHEIGLKVPEDISVLGFDNTKISKMSYPKLSTVGQPMYDIGKTAVEKLDAILRAEVDVELELRTYLKHEIIERDSVAENKVEDQG